MKTKKQAKAKTKKTKSKPEFDRRSYFAEFSARRRATHTQVAAWVPLHAVTKIKMHGGNMTAIIEKAVTAFADKLPSSVPTGETPSRGKRGKSLDERMFRRRSKALKYESARI
jgi:hypothetical protein